MSKKTSPRLSKKIHKATAHVRRRAQQSSRKISKLPPSITIIGVYTSLILITAVIAAIYATSHHTSSIPKTDNPFSNTQLITAKFTLYYPARLPDPLHIDPASINTTDAGIITIRITDGLGSATNRSLTISEQTTPSGFNISTFNDGMDNRTSIKTRFGQATIGTINLGQAKLATLVTDDHTLLLVQAETGVSIDDLTQLILHLEAAKPSAFTP